MSKQNKIRTLVVLIITIMYSLVSVFIFKDRFSFNTIIIPLISVLPVTFIMKMPKDKNE
jgi:hypothetical protein